MSRRRLGVRALKVAFAVTGLAFMAVAFARTWDGSVAELTVAWWRLPVGVALAVAGLWCAFEGWAALVGGAQRRALAAGFYLSQLGKYIPGGVWQAAGQIGYAAHGSVSVSRATTAFAAFTVTQAAAGGLVGSLVAVFHPAAPDPVRWGALAALALVLLLHRRWLLVAVGVVRRVQGRADSDDLVPRQRAIIVAFLWSLGTILTHGAVLTLILQGLSPAAGGLAVIPVAALAWTVGFLALPVPSGIGVREAVLVLALSPVAGPSVVIVASVYQRLLIMCGEAAMIVLGRWRVRGRTRSAPDEATSG